MTTQDETISNISKMLFYEWDPIGVKYFVGPDRYEKNADEYQKYANEIVHRFSEFTPEDEIFEFLKHACQKRMGLGRNKTDWSEERAVAAKVIKMLQGEC